MPALTDGVLQTVLDNVKFDAHGLVPAIAQDHNSGRVLMVAWMNREALKLTIEKQQAVYFSRSRNKLWHKGEESGHFQSVHDIRLDCDADVIVLQITQHDGIACHTGRESCFYQTLTENGWQTVDNVLKDPSSIYKTPAATTPERLTATVQDQEVLASLGYIMQERKLANPDSSYVASLYHKGINKILEKLGEECVETIIAAKDMPDAKNNLIGDSTTKRQDLIYETADLWFHSIVMLGYYDIAPREILDELVRRFDLSGLVEKAARKSSH